MGDRDTIFRPNHVNRLSTIITYAFLPPSFCQSLFRNFLKFCHHKSVGDPSRFFFSVWSIVALSVRALHFCTQFQLAPEYYWANSLCPRSNWSKVTTFYIFTFFSNLSQSRFAEPRPVKIAAFSLVFLLPVELKVRYFTHLKSSNFATLWYQDWP